MKILVIDDQPRNIAAALTTLAGHEVTVIDNIKQAYQTLEDFGAKRFDAVLTDLFLPLAEFNGSFSACYSEKAWDNHMQPTAQLPAGLVFALAAANVGVRTIICTDTDHHEDYICSLLDILYPPYKQGLSGNTESHTVAYVEARNARMLAVWNEENKVLVPSDQPDYENLVKDWHVAMVNSNMFPELQK